MGKIHRLHFAFALLLISFFCMQAAKCNPVMPSGSTSPGILFQSHITAEPTAPPFAWEEKEETITVLSLVTVISYRTFNEKSGKILLSSPVRLSDFRFLPSVEQKTTHLHILSGRHADGFYLYFLKKLLI